MIKKEEILDILSGPSVKPEYRTTKGIAYVIASVAHVDQNRDNGMHYINHPRNCVDMFYRYMTIEGWYRSDIITKNGLPCSGVVEVAYLHDVVEDTELTHEDIKEIYREFGHSDYFKCYIDEPLRLITHNKNENYETYITKVIKNPISSLVKTFDLADNMNLFGLSRIDEKAVNRAKKYIEHFKKINDEHHFLEKICKCREDMSNAWSD